MLRVTLVLIFSSLATRIKPHVNGVLFKIEENYFLFSANIIWNETADSLLTCSQMCARRAACKSANFLVNQETCCLLSKGQTKQEEKLLRRDGSFYLEKVGSSGELPELPGTTQSSAVSSCQSLHSQSPQASSGVYWINPDGGSKTNAFKAYCDMDTDGGGWTLVWSYTFTNYIHFTQSSNAIIPRPNWPLDPALVDVSISTTPPLSEADCNAMNFSYWKQLGKQVLIKSNINNWLTCHPGTGSLVDWQDGSINCYIVKLVTDTCNGALPPATLFLSKPFGPRFRSSANYYYFDGDTGNHWPTHDPCGTNKGNHMKNVTNPHGNIFIRG